MKRHAHLLALFGAVSQIVIPIGIVVSHLSLVSAKTAFDLSDPQDTERIMASVAQVTQQMATSVDYILWAFVLAMLGLIPFIYAITRLQYRRPWAFWFACLYGGLLTFAFPIGTAFGLFLLIYALSHRYKFLPVSHQYTRVVPRAVGRAI